MKQEHRFVAQLFGYLAPFIDFDRPVYVSLDGVAAKRGVHEKRFRNSIVPDICFTFLDGRHIAIEAKIIDGRNDKIWPSRTQYKSWFCDDDEAHKPTGWVIANENLSPPFFYASHVLVAEQPAIPKKSGYVGIDVPLKNVHARAYPSCT